MDDDKTTKPEDLQPDPKPKETSGEDKEPKQPTEGGMLRKKLEETLAELNKYKTQEQLLKEEEAKKKGDYEELLRQKEERISELENKHKQALIEANLSQAFSRVKVKEEFTDLIMEKGKHLIEFDESGAIKNLDDVVNNLSSTYPSAFNAQKTNTFGNVPTAQSQSNSNRYTMAEWKTMGMESRQRAYKEGTQPEGM